jgi:hypothetical protein
MKLKNIELTVVWAPDNQEAAEAFQRLRYREFTLQRSFESENESGLEKDEYDAFSYYVLAYNDGRLLGGCRLIDGNATSLPMEKYSWEAIERNSFEISRYTMDSALSRSEKENLQAVMDQKIHDTIVSLGGYFAFVNIRRALLRIKQGHSPFSFEQVGEPNVHPGAGILIPACHRMDENCYAIAA